ncbi:MAG TPA: hypothetical protein PKA17_04050 [Phenylobacterium sp.]|nr:hypothetical protein [Phenylobacterium sp.]
MARRAARFPAAAAALLLAACSPGLEGLDEDVLNREIGARIGDPTTCVLIARPDGTVVYRYGGAVVCGRAYPGCEGGEARTTEALLTSLGAPPRSVAASCPTAADGSRSVGWAAGPVSEQPYVFAAVMEGQRALPGVVMTDRLARAFAAAGR